LELEASMMSTEVSAAVPKDPTWFQIYPAELRPGDLVPFYVSTASGVALTFALVVEVPLPVYRNDGTIQGEFDGDHRTVKIIEPTTCKRREIRITWGQRSDPTAQKHRTVIEVAWQGDEYSDWGNHGR
jgi:hypothetical protein